MSDISGPQVGPGAAEPPGSVAVLTTDSGVRLVLSGQVDAGMNTELVEAVHEATRIGLPVDVDTRTVTFMDSTVIALMAHMVNRLAHPVRFIEPPEVVRFLLDLTHIDEVVDVVDEEEVSSEPRSSSD
ncbi:hypothetical protein GCM10023169_01580 [Georgenia halophila]|uniref:MlaB-like STAS domain-containing protein n=1 Tax=Georgenia halophila TaxID=620889 RepID=A0ABP8KTB8_9MICO